MFPVLFRSVEFVSAIELELIFKTCYDFHTCWPDKMVIANSEAGLVIRNSKIFKIVKIPESTLLIWSNL